MSAMISRKKDLWLLILTVAFCSVINSPCCIELAFVNYIDFLA